MRVMITRRVAARTLLATTGVLAAVSLAACTGGVTGSVSASQPQQPTNTSPQTSVAAAPSQAYTSPVGSAQATGTPTNAPTPTAPPATVTSNTTPACKANMLRLSFGGGDAGMSQRETVLRFTNVGGRSCVIAGFPGVSYVAGPNGTQVGAAAVRTGPMGPRVVLGPAQVASTVIHSVDVGVFDANVCKPTPVRGYRIYAPGDTAAMFIPLGNGTEGCAGTSPDPQLDVHSIKLGLGSPDQP
jgi:hypothetical protein